MNKPDWKDAPAWANWLASDKPGYGENCGWVFFEEKPFCDHQNAWMQSDGAYRQVTKGTDCEDWENSLEKRP